MKEVLEAGPENMEKITSRIKLHFLRHGPKVIKEGLADEVTPLSDVGRMEAKKKATIGSISQSVAFGGPRPRTLETAGFVLGGNQDSILGTETLDELRAKLDDELYGEGKGGHPSKIGIDPRLDIHDASTAHYDDKLDGAIQDTSHLQALFERSDVIARELGDTTADTYSRMASNVAMIIQKYIEIAPRFNVLVQDSSKHYTDTMERVLSTHFRVCESFLGKVIELTKGLEARDRFAEALDMETFGYLEGFDVEIVIRAGEELELRVSFHKQKKDGTSFDFDEKVPISILQEISE